MGRAISAPPSPGNSRHPQPVEHLEPRRPDRLGELLDRRVPLLLTLALPLPAHYPQRRAVAAPHRLAELPAEQEAATARGRVITRIATASLPIVAPACTLTCTAAEWAADFIRRTGIEVRNPKLVMDDGDWTIRGWLPGPTGGIATLACVA